MASFKSWVGTGEGWRGSSSHETGMWTSDVTPTIIPRTGFSGGTGSVAKSY